MTESTEKANRFREELIELLKKYNAELETEDHWTGYSECGEDVRMTVSFANETINDEYVVHADLDLGRWITKND